MFLIFEDYKINEIIDNIREFIHISDFLFSGLEKGTQQILVMRPENIYSCYSELYCMWLKIVEKLNYVKSKLGDLPFSYSNEDSQRALNEYIITYINYTDCLHDFADALNEAYYKHDVSGASGNPANVSDFCWWQCMYCQQYPFIKMVSMDLIEQLNMFQEGIKMISMANVYASPERMQSGMFLNESTDTYPFIHAQTFGKENNFEENMMLEIYGSPKMMRMSDIPVRNVRFCLNCGQSITDQTQYCHTCGKRIQETKDLDVTTQFCSNCGRNIPLISVFCPFCGRKMRTSYAQQETPIGGVYASPEWMGRSKRKECNFLKIFKRKR